MEQNELMIGDWVYQPVPEQPYFQIESFYDLGDADDYIPIPITPEILEKNRFIKRNSPGYPEHFSYELPSENMVFEIFALYDSDFSFNINYTAMKIKYVHELQHALKLCKIDKEIKL